MPLTSSSLTERECLFTSFEWTNAKPRRSRRYGWLSDRNFETLARHRRSQQDQRNTTLILTAASGENSIHPVIHHTDCQDGTGFQLLRAIRQRPTRSNARDVFSKVGSRLKTTCRAESNYLTFYEYRAVCDSTADKQDDQNLTVHFTHLAGFRDDRGCST